MFKNIFSWFLALVLLVSVSAAGYAVIKGLDEDARAVVKVGENVVVAEGSQVKSAVAVGGDVVVYGEVVEDAVAIGGKVTLKDSAMIGGDVVSIGGETVKEPGAIVRGEVINASIQSLSPAVSMATRKSFIQGIVILAILGFISFLALSAIIVSLFTPQLGKVSAEIEKKAWGSFLWGLLITILFIPVTIMLALTIIGIIIIPVWVGLVVAAGIFGYIAVGHVVGKKVLRYFRVYGKTMMTETMFGIILLALISLAPFLGGLIKIIVVFCGLGAAYLTRFGLKA